MVFCWTQVVSQSQHNGLNMMMGRCSNRRIGLSFRSSTMEPAQARRTEEGVEDGRNGLWSVLYPGLRIGPLSNLVEPRGGHLHEQRAWGPSERVHERHGLWQRITAAPGPMPVQCGVISPVRVRELHQVGLRGAYRHSFMQGWAVY